MERKVHEVDVRTRVINKHDDAAQLLKDGISPADKDYHRAVLAFADILANVPGAVEALPPQPPIKRG
jgi:hypothetical protein